MKLKLIQILSFLFALNVFGQVTIVGLTDEKEFKQNKKFTITFILQINGNDLVQETPIKLPDFSKFEELGSASDQNTIVDSKTGVMINQIIYQKVLQPKQSGKLKIGSALVQVNGKMYKSEPFDIFVKEADKKSVENNSISKNNNDLFLNVEIKDKEVYQFQSTVAVIKVYSKDYDQFRKVTNVQLPHSKAVDVEIINTKPSEIEPSEEFPNFLSQTIAEYSITPNQPGKIEVPNAVAVFKNNGKNHRLISPKSKISVNNLPENSPANFKNAIGNFEVSLTKNSTEEFQEVGKPIDIFLKISGEGNLHKLSLPVLYPSSNYQFYPPKITKNIISNGNSYQGEIVAHYILVPKKSGEITLKTDHFSYFDNDKKQYFDLGNIVLPLNILTSEQFENTKSTLEKMNNYTNTVLDKVENPILKTADLKVDESSKINWKFVWINLALVFGLFYFSFIVNRFIKAKKSSKPTSKTLPKPIGSVAETELEIRKNKKTDFQSYYNYFELLASKNSDEVFLKSYQDFFTEVQQDFQTKYHTTLQEYLETNDKQEYLLEFSLLNKKLEMEKYNPYKNSESLQELSQAIKIFYKKIEVLV
jgi:hypothetical protein